MPTAMLWLWSFLLSICLPIAGRIIAALGFGLVTYTGIDMLLSTAAQTAVTYLYGAPADFLTILGMLGVDRCLNIIISAYVVRIAFKGMMNAQPVWTAHR